ncbi:MAG TPA: hypothetical protein VJ327_04235 [Patescibacteria group bacterium]|nr:hypothetical protein [Patescibacteria group bacterium]
MGTAGIQHTTSKMKPKGRTAADEGEKAQRQCVCVRRMKQNRRLIKVKNSFLKFTRRIAYHVPFRLHKVAMRLKKA